MNPEDQNTTIHETIDANLHQNPNTDPATIPAPEYFTTPVPQQNPQVEGSSQYIQPNVATDTVYANMDQAEVYEAKPKSKKMLIISLVAGLLLLTTAGLLLLNYFDNQNKASVANKNNAISSAIFSSTSSAMSSVENNMNSTNQKPLNTGGLETPASKAKTNMNTQLTPVWLTEKFATISGAVDNGKCLLETTCGESSDYDRDGISNLYESQYGTDPLDFDTDKDGLADGDELAVYYTDPTKVDSDMDTFKDSDELANCYDPIIVEKNKMSNTRRQAVENNMDFKGVTAETIKFFISKTYPAADQKAGYGLSKCGPVATVTSSAVSTATSMPVANP